jgi:hypothetical protein
MQTGPPPNPFNPGHLIFKHKRPPPPPPPPSQRKYLYLPKRRAPGSLSPTATGRHRHIRAVLEEPVPVLSDLEILLCPISVEKALAPGGIGTWLAPSAHEPTWMSWWIGNDSGGPPSFSFCLFSGPVSLLSGTKVGVAPISSSLLLVRSTREPQDPPTEHARSFGEELPLRPPPRPPCSPC